MQRVSNLEKDVKELKQVDHTLAILELIKSKLSEAINKYLGSTLRDTLQKVLQRHTKELRHELSQTPIIKVKVHKVQARTCCKGENAKSHERHLAHKELYDALIQSLLVGENDMDRLAVDPASQRKRRHDDKDQDPPAGSDQGMKKRRTGKDAKPSKKSSKSMEYTKGKTPSNTSKTDNVANDADEPQADAIPKIPKKDWFKKSPRPKILNPDRNIVKTVDDAP
ncbi:hypothetical protein Tco_1043533 [Tanacetum coccineum]|uniref:Uncharacterized protein n=1 Tax=Tanacetum coccineum TaxID=301880 RepID=A0ABQ5GPW6_9ASTR